MSFEAQGYTVMDIDKIEKVMGDRILLEWQMNTDELLGGKLIRPDTYKAMHYTGVVVKAGPLVDPEIRPGVRLLFDQFSSPERFWDPEKKKRYAMIEESKQGSPFAIIPMRAKVAGVEGDFNWEA